VPLLWLLEPLLPLEYEELWLADDEDTDGLRYVGLLPADAFCFADDCCDPEETDVLCLAAALLAVDELPDTLVAEVLFLDDELPLIVPRRVLLLVPMPLLTVVLLPLSENTLVSLCVSCLGPYHILFPKCPPLPIPGP